MALRHRKEDLENDDYLKQMTSTECDSGKHGCFVHAPIG